MDNPVTVTADALTNRRAGSCAERSFCLRWWSVVWVVLFAFGVVRLQAADAQSSTNASAKVSISGLGLLGNHDMKRLLKNFQPDGQLPKVITRSFVEDASLVMFSRVRNEGYLDAKIRTTLKLDDGRRQEVLWTNSMDVLFPHDFTATEVSFEVIRGTRYYYTSLEIEGLTAIKKDDARSYFAITDALLRLHRNRVFSPDLLKASMTALTEALLRKGYADAVVRTNSIILDTDTGGVDVKLTVEQGLHCIVRSVEVTLAASNNVAGTNWVLRPDEPYSLLWQQNFSRVLREKEYGKGYPDTVVQMQILRSTTNAADIQLDLAAQIRTGERIWVGGVEIKGNKRTRHSVLENQVKLREGELLDSGKAEESRQKLARLGVFKSVSLDYEDMSATNRKVIYELKESKPINLSLLAGYGSYELLRGGVEFENHNVLGYAHDLRLRAVESFKSTSAEGQYTVPEIFGRDMDAFLRGSALRREEVTFTREEYGGSVGVHKYIDPIKTDLALHYDYQWLNANDLGRVATNDIGRADARSAAIVLDFNRDQRHSPLLPRTGTRFYGKLEFAAADLGGNVTYQRFVLGNSFHIDLGGGRLLHLGLLHGISFTLGGDSSELPFGKRFFPGGENSVRGYKEGEASPLDSNGDQLGAETYLQGNIELEQLITKTWSVVAFVDGVGFAKNRNDYPMDEELYSVGGGVNWRSPIGPVRLEYGYNPDPRSHDPTGTLHFSIGFPF